MNRQDLKQAGKNLFKKNYWHSVLIAFLMVLGFSEDGGSISITTPANSSSFEDIFSGGDLDFFFEEFLFTSFSWAIIASSVAIIILSYFIFIPLKCGGIRYFLKSRKNQPVEIKEIAENLKDKTYLNIAKVNFFKGLYTFLWSLLFLIPGIIKSYEYAAVNYILAVRPDIDKDEALRLSKILMDGNKWDLFVLRLSFIGWDVLSGLTMGVLFYLYVNPYKQATYVEFFSDLRLQALAKGTITPNDIPDYEVYNPYYQNPFDQSQNNFYSPQYNPTENNFYAPQEPVQQPIEHPIAQLIEPVVESPVEEPVIEPTEPIEEIPTEE